MSETVKNIECPKCSAPIVAFLFKDAQPAGIHPKGGTFHVDKTTDPHEVVATCSACGNKTPLDPELTQPYFGP